jgi:hypothetical protein
MAHRAYDVFPVLSTKERIFAKHYARTNDPVASIRAAGHLDADDCRTRAVARQYLANDCILQFIEEELVRINKTINYDREYILENAAKVVEFGVEKRGVPIKNSERIREVMNEPAAAVKAMDLMAKITGLYDPAREGGNKQLAIINIQLNNNEEKRI